MNHQSADGDGRIEFDVVLETFVGRLWKGVDGWLGIEVVSWFLVKQEWGGGGK
jgi:hypothetical protein